MKSSSFTFELTDDDVAGGPGLTIEDVAMEISSAASEVAVTVVDARPGGSGAYQIIPSDKLGYSYYALAAKPDGRNLQPTRMAVVAIEDDTEVTFQMEQGSSLSFFHTTTENGQDRAALYGGMGRGVLTITLDKGEVAHITPAFANADVTGTQITAKKRFGVFTASPSISWSDGNPDMMAQMMVPEHGIGSEYILVPIPGQSKYGFLVQAVQDGTTTNQAGVSMDAGETYPESGLPQEASSALFVSSVNPIVVAQYALGVDGSDDSAASMVILPSIAQYSSSHRLTVPSIHLAKNSWLLLAMPGNGQTQNNRDLFLDGVELPSSTVWQSVPGKAPYEWAQVRVPRTGYTRIQHKDPLVKFGAYLYSDGDGGDDARSMMFTGSTCLETLQPVSRLFLIPSKQCYQRAC